jgi:hypothetical protein
MPEVEDVEIKTQAKQKVKEDVEKKEQPSLIDIVISMPEVEYKAQMLALLSEIVQRLREEQGGENVDK